MTPEQYESELSLQGERLMAAWRERDRYRLALGTARAKIELAADYIDSLMPHLWSAAVDREAVKNEAQSLRVTAEYLGSVMADAFLEAEAS